MSSTNGSSGSTDRPAVACSLSDAPEAFDERLAEYHQLLGAAFVSGERFAGGVRWTLRGDPGIEPWARDLAVRETACCPFLRIDVRTDAGLVRWDVSTFDDPAALAVLDLFDELPGEAGVRNEVDRPS